MPISRRGYLKICDLSGLPTTTDRPFSIEVARRCRRAAYGLGGRKAPSGGGSERADIEALSGHRYPTARLRTHARTYIVRRPRRTVAQTHTHKGQRKVKRRTREDVVGNGQQGGRGGAQWSGERSATGGRDGDVSDRSRVLCVLCVYRYNIRTRCRHRHRTVIGSEGGGALLGVTLSGLAAADRTLRCHVVPTRPRRQGGCGCSNGHNRRENITYSVAGETRAHTHMHTIITTWVRKKKLVSAVLHRRVFEGLIFVRLRHIHYLRVGTIIVYRRKFSQKPYIILS